MLYKEWLNEWLDDYIKPTSKSRTYGRYCELIKTHIAPALGDYDIKDLSIDVMQRFVGYLLIGGNKRTKNGLSSNTVCSETPKTKSSKRIIPLPAEIITMLKTLKTTSESEFVVADGGKGVSVRSYQRSFDLLLKRLGIPHKGFHAIRHTFATRAMECGMDAKTLSEILGHKNPIVTLNRYTHSMPGHKKEMMNRVGKLFRN